MQALLRDSPPPTPACAWSPAGCRSPTWKSSRAPHRPIELEHVKPEAGASLLKVMGVKGDDEELQRASADFGGHCLALTLLGGCLTDAFAGDVLQRRAVGPLEQDMRTGGHASRWMKSYENWFVAQPEVHLLRVLGLFDRPATAEALGALKALPAILDLTDKLTGLGRVESARVISAFVGPGCSPSPTPRSRTASTLILSSGSISASNYAGSFPRPGGGNNRLYMHFTSQAPELPSSVKEMEPLFQAIVFGCKAGRETDALHEVYFAGVHARQEMYAADKLSRPRPAALGPVPFLQGRRLGSAGGAEPAGAAGLGHPDHARSWSMPECITRRQKASPPGRLASSFPRPGSWVRMMPGHSPGSAPVDSPPGPGGHQQGPAARCPAPRHRQALDKSSYLVEAKMSRGVTNYYAGNFRIAAGHLSEAIATYDVNGHRTSSRITGVDPGVAAHAYQALTQWAMGQPEDACQMGDRWVALADHIGHPFSKFVAMSVVVQIAQFLREPELTHLRAQEMIDFANQQGSLLFLSHGHFLKAWA